MSLKPSIVLIAVVVLLVSACGTLQVGIEPDSGAEIPDIEPTEVVESPGVQLSSKDNSEEENAVLIEVNAWAGQILSLPDGAQYDDFLLLLPEGVGAVGLTGATAEVEQEIIGLRDAEPPLDHVLVWGMLACEGSDYGGCLLTVDRLSYGAVRYDPEPVEGWQGFITTSTFNMGQSFIFVLQSEFPMWYSIHSTDEALLQQLEELAGSQNLIRVSGELITSVPDVNGTRIQVSELQVLGPAVQEIAAPEALEDFDPTDDWKVLTNELYRYEIHIPEGAEVEWIGPQGFDSAEVPAGVSSEEYFSMLEYQYGSWLCLEITYSLGTVLVGAPLDEGGQYATCARTGVGAGEITAKQEQLTVDGMQLQAEGFEVYSGAETLDSHSETMSIEMENGMRIQYGSNARPDASFDDYVMKTREIIQEIVCSYRTIP